MVEDSDVDNSKKIYVWHNSEEVIATATTRKVMESDVRGRRIKVVKMDVFDCEQQKVGTISKSGGAISAKYRVYSDLNSYEMKGASDGKEENPINIYARDGSKLIHLYRTNQLNSISDVTLFFLLAIFTDDHTMTWTHGPRVIALPSGKHFDSRLLVMLAVADTYSSL